MENFKTTKNTRSHYQLKVKTVSLADEGRTIHKMERKLLNKIKRVTNPIRKRILVNAHNSLRDHRLFVVRTESRATHLARAFLSGKAYSDVEHNASSNPQSAAAFRRAIKIIAKYGTHDNKSNTEEMFNKWVNG